jgi:hypothetical protein
MTPDTADEIQRVVVCDLPTLSCDARRAERVRAMCRTKLEHERRRSRRLAVISQFGRHLVVPALTAGLFALYAADLVSITVRTFNA